MDNINETSESEDSEVYLPPVYEPIEKGFGTVIGENNMRVYLVEVQFYKNADPSVMHVTLNEGEHLILEDWAIANELAAIWTDVRWDEISKVWVGEGDELEPPDPPLPLLKPPQNLDERVEELEVEVEHLNNIINNLLGIEAETETETDGE